MRRAKEKRLKKDAGRTRWSHYFRSIKGSCSPRSEKFLEKDQLKVDYDSFSNLDLSSDSYSTVNFCLDDGTSQQSIRPSYLNGSSSPVPCPSNHSPSSVVQKLSFGSYPDNIICTKIGQNESHIVLKSQSLQGSRISDISNNSSSTTSYPDFPPSPDSWLGDSAHSNLNSSTIPGAKN